MKKSTFTEEQIITILKRANAGEPLADVCRQAGISDSTFYRWKAKYDGLEVNELKRLKQLEDENRRLKQIVADLTLDNTALKDVLAKNYERPLHDEPWLSIFEHGTVSHSGGRVACSSSRAQLRAISRVVRRRPSCATGSAPWLWLDHALGTDG